MAGVLIQVEPARGFDARIRKLFAALRPTRLLRGVLMRTILFVRRQARDRLERRTRTWMPLGRRRLGASLTVQADDTSAVTGSALQYARIQQTGGFITPKGGRKYLALPAQGHLARNGVWPRDLGKDHVRFVPNAEIKIGSHSWIGPALVRKSDTPALSEFGSRRGRAGGKRPRRPVVRKAGEVMFALIKRATIRPRPYLLFLNEERQFLERQLETAYARATGGV